MERRHLPYPDQQDSVPASKIRLDLFQAPLNQFFCLCSLKRSFSIKETYVRVQVEQCNCLVVHCSHQSAFTGLMSCRIPVRFLCFGSGNGRQTYGSGTRGELAF